VKSIIKLASGDFEINLEKPIDISLCLGKDQAMAWYLDQVKIEPISTENWIGKVSEGANVNFNKIEFSPHANGTHTESYGHISKEFYSISKCLKTYFFKAKLISLQPEKINGDQVFTQELFKEKIIKNESEALIIRSLPNGNQKKDRNYNHSNWPYLSAAAAEYIRECEIKHLLIDLPSVDREEGEVLAHKAFWNYPENPRKEATITELIYVPDEIKDGFYVLNLQVAHFENDAAPSRPVLYEILNS